MFDTRRMGGERLQGKTTLLKGRDKALDHSDFGNGLMSRGGSFRPFLQQRP